MVGTAIAMVPNVRKPNNSKSDFKCVWFSNVRNLSPTVFDPNCTGYFKMPNNVVNKFSNGQYDSLSILLVEPEQVLPECRVFSKMLKNISKILKWYLVFRNLVVSTRNTARFWFRIAHLLLRT